MREKQSGYLMRALVNLAVSFGRLYNLTYFYTLGEKLKLVNYQTCISEMTLCARYP